MNKNVLRQKVIYGMAREPDFVALGRDEVLAIKCDKDVEHWRFEQRGARARGERSYEHDANIESKDSMGDLIFQAGWNLQRITMPNSRMSVLLNHDPRPVPAGVVDYGHRGWTQDDAKLHSLILGFSIHDLDDYADSEAGRIVEAHHRLMSKKKLTGGSVGFFPLKARPPADDAEREKYGLNSYSIVFEEQELLEYSITSIPAHPGAHDRRSLEQDIRECGLEPTVADYWLRAALTSPEEWIERNVPNISRKIFALPERPSWMKGAKSADDAPHGACVSCSDAKSALADTVRAVVREELNVLRSVIDRTPAASLTTSPDSTAERGPAGAQAQDAESLRKPGTSERDQPVPIDRIARAVSARLSARDSNNGSERNRAGRSEAGRA